MENNRKRLRSQEDDARQRKFFVNQRIVDKNDKIAMEKVFGKKKREKN